jgi:hypothetical protein
MNTLRIRLATSLAPLCAALMLAPASAQVPVDGDGAPLADYETFGTPAPAGNEDIPLLSQSELQELVGPVALYPDDLLAIVLPASTYPLQLVQAQRFLEDLEDDPSLKPDDDWDDSVIALLNYPEVLELLNADLDWTWRLGEAVVAQQPDVVSAVEDFRGRAYAAGNLKSDSHQTVSHDEGVIEITPVADDVIYVPYYEPERVVVYQSRPVYRYYPRAYPVYYYPYPVGYAFDSGFFWGVTTAFTVGWLTDSVHVIHHSYRGHPYYGRRYWDGWWYRRPTVYVHNHYYSTDRHSVSRYRYSRGDYWRPRHESRRRLHNQRVARSDYYTGRSVRHRTAEAVTTPRTPVRHTHRSQTAQAALDRREPHRARGAADYRRPQRPEATASTIGQAQGRIATTDRGVERRHGSNVRSQHSRNERVVRRDPVAVERRSSSHRAGDSRQERRAEAPRRQEPMRSRPQRPKDIESAGTATGKRHASTQRDSRRRQRAE